MRDLFEDESRFGDVLYEDPMNEFDEQFAALGEGDGWGDFEDFEDPEEFEDFEFGESGLGFVEPFGSFEDFEGGGWPNDLDQELWSGEGPPLDYQIIGADTRRYVSKATLVPWRHICAVQIKVEGRWMNNGSGTLIGPRTVLTAGHVVAHNKKYPMRVVPAAKGESAPFGCGAVKTYKMFPSYNPATPADIALMYLDRSLGTKVGYWTSRPRPSKANPKGLGWYRGQASAVKNVNVSGYPNDRPFTKSWKCRSGATGTCNATSPWSSSRGLRCGKYQYWAWNTVNGVSGGMIRYQNDTCVGHSGSPVWIAPKGKARRLVAVHVAGSSSGNTAVYLTPAKQKWIAARIK